MAVSAEISSAIRLDSIAALPLYSHAARYWSSPPAGSASQISSRGPRMAFMKVAGCLRTTTLPPPDPEEQPSARTQSKGLAYRPRNADLIGSRLESHVRRSIWNHDLLHETRDMQRQDSSKMSLSKNPIRFGRGIVDQCLNLVNHTLEHIRVELR